MLDEKELKILVMLRQNARATLTEISRETDIPVSTVFDKLKKMEKKFHIRHTSLIDFSRLGKAIQVNFSVKSDEQINEIISFLVENPNVNSVYRTNSGTSIYLECIFQNMMEFYKFSDKLAKYKITEKSEYHIIEEIKKEEFLTKEHHLRSSQKRGF